MPHRWETRYSSCEMMYLEIAGTGVRVYLDHSANNASIYTFDQVLAGALDGEVGSVFGKEVLTELRAEVQARKDGRTVEPPSKEELMRRRRLEK